MENKETKVTKVTVTLVIKDLVSKKGNQFRVLSAVVNGKQVSMGFLPAELELALYKAGALK